MLILILSAFLHLGLPLPLGEITQAAQEANFETYSSRNNVTNTTRVSKPMQHPTTNDLSKRDANCPIPSDLPERLDQLNPELNLSQIVASTTQEQLAPYELKNLKCPERNGDWWPKFTKLHNLESMCPWEYEVLSLGDEFYPSKINEAKCLCAQCIHANANNCYKVRTPLLVFKRLRCNHGVAIMQKEQVMYTAGCQCISNFVSSGDIPVTQ